MATVYCAQCGTKNPEGSKFCGTCGARLARAQGLICPMCSTANPIENVFCSNCSARLMPLVGGSEPTAAPPIRGLSLPTKPAPPSAESLESEAPSPDWTADLRAPAPTGEESARGGNADQPEWIDRAQAEKETTEPTSAVPDDEASWIRELRRAATENASIAPKAESDDDIPDWLRASAPGENAGITDQPDATNWAERERETARGADESADTITSRAGLPSWLHAAEEEESRPLASAAEWSSARPVFAPTEETRESEGTAASVPLADEMPDWLRMAQATDEKPASEPVPQPAQSPEIPAWVAALKPPELVASMSSTEPVELSGPLAGLRGVLPLAKAVAQPHTAIRAPARDNGQSGAQLFEAILATPPTAEFSVPAKKRRALTMSPWLYALLLLAVLIPFFIPASFAASGVRIPGTPAAEFFDNIQTLPANATVLLSFDYDASNAGEMDLFAMAITRQLMSKRVKIVAVSTFETGPQIAQRVLDDAARQNNYRYGADYVNAGYIAGQEAGLAQFAVKAIPANARDYAQKQLLAAMAITQNIKTPADFAFVIELAGTESALKMWLEQVQPRANARFAAATSAAVEPKARAYKDARQLTALMSGLVGAAQYEVLSGQPGQAVVRVTAQSAAQVVLVLAVVLGNIAFVVSRLRGKK